MRVVLLGPPGAGKGTQADRIADRFGVRHLATGQLLRDEVAGGTELGRKAKDVMERGDLVPDEIVVGMVRRRLDQPEMRAGFVLDGFPRTVPQAEALDGCLAGLGLALDAVLDLQVAEGELLRRLAGRAREQGRSEDESAAAVRRRLVVFNDENQQLVAYYRAGGLLAEVDAIGTLDEVTGRILAALGQAAAARPDRGDAEGGS